MAAQDFRWNSEKNEWLKLNRGLSFEMVVKAVELGQVTDNIEHPSRPHQRILIVELNGYFCAVPYVIDGDVLFLKTIYPDRTLDEKYRKTE
jgi:hypothetical protein